MNGSNKTPFYTVLLENGKSITYLIEELRAEDCDKEDDIIQFVIKTSDFSVVNNKFLQVGRKLKIRFGFLAGLTFDIWLMEISERVPVHSAILTFKVTATALSYVMKKGSDTRGYENKKPSEIISDIAKKNGLKVDLKGIQDTVIDKINQANRSDWDFLTDLLKKQPGGPYRMTVKNDRLRVQKIDLKKKPGLQLFLGPGGNLKSFSPKEKENTKTGAAAAVTVTNQDPETGKPQVQVKVNRANSKDIDLGFGATMGRVNGKVDLGFGNDTGNILSKFRRSDALASGFPDTNPEKQKAYAQNKSQLQNLGELEATAELGEGDPRFKPEMILPVRGVGKLYSGNWYCKKVIHVITRSGGYSGSVELDRNATATAVAATTPPSNQKNTQPDGGDVNKINLQLYLPNGLLK